LLQKDDAEGENSRAKEGRANAYGFVFSPCLGFPETQSHSIFSSINRTWKGE